MSSRKFSKTRTRLWRIESSPASGDSAAGPAAAHAPREERGEERTDVVATEEPLEIRLRWGGAHTRTVAVTMRTPGADRELAAGFLFSEGVIHAAADVARFTALVPATAGPAADSLAAPAAGPFAIPALTAGPSVTPAAPAAPAEPAAVALEEAAASSNVLEVELAGAEAPEMASLERHFFATSACGVCGKAGLDTLSLRIAARDAPAPPAGGPRLTPALLASLPAKLRAAQGLFEATGGLHAAALFDGRGQLLAVREDVGRHNALDKLVGWAFLAGLLPLRDHVLLVSGRTSYEILQKSAVAGLPVVCAISAPSSLAVELAQRFDITLVGFLRGERCNVYSGIERIETAVAGPARRRTARFAILPTGAESSDPAARRRPM